MKPRIAPALPFDPQQHQHQRQDHQRNLRRPARVVVVQPGREYPRSQGLHPEMLHRAEIGNRLHQDQRHTRRNRRARQG